MKQTDLKRAVNLTALVLAAGLLMGMLTGCPHKPKDDPKPQTVTITVKGDTNVTVNDPKTLAVTKGTKWSEVKAKVKVSYKEGYEANGFKLDSASGEELKDNYAFNENKTVFALSKIKAITYKVEHWQQNAEDDKYTLKETEKISGKAGENTAATAKTYEGFTAKAVTQQKIKADSSTVVKIEYDRNIITLKLNLNGGSTDTPLENGEGGTKLLKGKYGAKVKLENLGKTGNVLEKWTPPLPETFPASSPDTTYTASWVDGYIVTIKGDERTEIADNTFKATLSPIQTWNDIKAQVKAKVNLKTKWQGGDYEVYEWRLGDENGQKLTGTEGINRHITVYAVTNYNKFNIIGDKIKLTADGKGYTGEKPKVKIIIPDGITEIEGSTDWDKGAFRDCSEITSVKLPQSLTQIGERAFYRCTGLTSINLPEGLTQIGTWTFTRCTGLTSINLPEGLTQIGERTFSGCTGLTSLTVDSGNAVYKAENNIVYTKDGKTLVCAAGGLTSATILDTVTAISEGAFAECRGLTSINLPESLTQIGRYAFDDCTGLTNINLPAGLTEIGWSAFSDCTGLASINLPASLTKIGEFAFARCTGLTSINLPASLTKIGRYAFDDCTGLTSLTVDSGNTVYKAENNIVYTKDGKTLVCAARGLTSATIPASVTKIDTGAFSGCTGLTSINLPASLTQIGEYAFAYCTGLTSAVFADTENWKADGSPIDSNDLKDPAKAAQYLSKDDDNGGYCDKEWKKR